MRLTKDFDNKFGYELLADNPNTSIEQDISNAVQKLGQLEDIEDRLLKYKEIGINGLVDLFKNLTDEDIEYIVQLSFKEHKVVYEIK